MGIKAISASKLDIFEYFELDGKGYRCIGTKNPKTALYEFEYNHACISSYEGAQAYLIEIGRIKKKDCKDCKYS